MVYHFCGWNSITHAVPNFVSESRWQLHIDDAELLSDFRHKSVTTDTPSLNLQVFKKIHLGSWPPTKCNETLHRPLVLMCEFWDICCEHVRKKLHYGEAQFYFWSTLQELIRYTFEDLENLWEVAASHSAQHQAWIEALLAEWHGSGRIWHNKMADIFKTIYSNVYSWMKILVFWYLLFFLWAQLTSHLWFR